MNILKKELNCIKELVLDSIKKNGKVKAFEQISSNIEKLEHCKKETVVYSYKNLKAIEFTIEKIITYDYHGKVLSKDKIFYKKQKDGDLRRYMHFPDNPPEKPVFEDKSKLLLKFFDGDIRYIIFNNHIEAIYKDSTMEYHTYITTDKFTYDKILQEVKVYKSMCKN